MSTMNDDDLGHLLKELPRRRASPEFTDRVLARVDAGEGRGYPVRRSLKLAAALAVIVVLGVGLFTWRERRADAERLQLERVRVMRHEYRALERELEELRSLAAEAQPVLELGGTERVDFVFDLRRHADGRERDDGQRARPTSHSPR